ncbi:uncharacterized protein E0L32_006890 [Thyridium curvatum]|uniref:Uncharacterized protein n=1 Tax=Thyridium curvatum TaxID=1093900 RepID=A0A507B6K9_9PEZI|nr:uncharacterized protein E0L32_006890 [Thyridium curvatum]TPX12478.1 hypothetical protein E0L32_006890 [Thyridium curvatum]
MRYSLIVVSLLQIVTAASAKPKTAVISGRTLKVKWTQASDGWTTQILTRSSGGQWKDASSLAESHYAVVSNKTTAAQATLSVQNGQAGHYTEFAPVNITSSCKLGTVTTTSVLEDGIFTATWSIDTSRSWDVISVNTTWVPKAGGWYSIVSPRVVDIADDALGWGVVPGFWSSNQVESNHTLAYTYVQGVPIEPLVSVEAATTSLVSILSDTQSKLNFAVMPHPSLARDPYPSSDISGQQQWNVGMSLRSRNGTLSPTAYYPVLGKAHSQMSAGTSVSATFLYVVTDEPHTWFEVNKFVHNEVYPLSEYAKRAKNLLSLRERLNRIHDFVVTPASKWNLWKFQNLTLGAESAKLSDVAAMWMVQNLTNDPQMLVERLPYARNFKLAQQDTTGGPFDGAALGEYYKNGAFVSEIVWIGHNEPDYVSPLFTTFYTLSDVGNILLFNATDDVLFSRFKKAAEKLLSWQKADGSFDIGYIRSDPKTVKYPQLTDNRATWYGFITAYRVLKDQKYLEAAEAGAQWFIKHVLATGRWLGVCDDAYLYPDFATIFAAQALLDLYDLTQDKTYLDAAIETAKFYTLHIFNHPVNSDAIKTRGSEKLQDWQLSQVALNYEHAGFTGTATERGPIFISSHAGTFIRIHEATGDKFFLELARLAARGRDAFVDARSGIPSYYWYQGNAGGSRYPWHGWWHIGWVTDYLISSAHLLSGGQIDFPHGFITAKVGSHVPYGFAPGRIYGQDAELWQPRSLVTLSDPEVDYITARTPDKKKLFVIMINEADSAKQATLSLNPRSLTPFKVAKWGSAEVLAGSGSKSGDNTWGVELSPNGITVLSIGTSVDTDPNGPSFRTFNITGAAGRPTVSWSFWATVKSWAEWTTPGASNWTASLSNVNYTFSTPLDLSTAGQGSVQIRIASQEGDFIGHSEPVTWQL